MFLGEDGSKRIPDEGAVEKLAPAPPDPAFGYRVIQRRQLRLIPLPRSELCG
jgi:hypothetical protein